jgi:hypothetical protein
VPEERPERSADTAVVVDPEPALADAVFDPYDVDFPYSTYQVVDCPPGSTLPVTVALVEPTAVVGPVVAFGAAARALAVTTNATSTADAPVSVTLHTPESISRADGGSAGAA